MAQLEDSELTKIREDVLAGKAKDFSISDNGMLLFKARAMGTNLKFSTAFHPQTDGQSERTIQILEDLLRACVMDFGGSWSKQKSYADPKRRDVTFQPGDHVFLRVSPMKGIRRFGKKGKLSPRFIGPFEILEKVGQVAYRLALPPSLSAVHNVFHVSMLRKYVSDPMHVMSYEALELQPDLSYDEQPVQILDKKEKVLRTKTIPLVKVLWRNSKVEEATWELESDMRAQHPELFR
ncbi:hypothetical protein CsatB_006682 [Cannabis sativa]